MDEDDKKRLRKLIEIAAQIAIGVIAGLITWVITNAIK